MPSVSGKGNNKQLASEARIVIKIDSEQLKKFADRPESLLDESLETQLAVASFYATPAELLDVLTGESTFDAVREAAAAHVSKGELTRCAILPATNGGKCGFDMHRPSTLVDVHSAILAHTISSRKSKYSEQVMEILASDSSEEIRKLAASNAMTPSSVLAKLAGDANRRILTVLASNKNTPGEVLDRLHVQYKLVDFKNPALPATVFDRVVNAVNQGKVNRYAEFRNVLSGPADSKIPEHILSTLALDTDRNIRIMVAKHPAAPGSALANLVLDADEGVRKEALAHKNAPTAAIAELFAKTEAEESKPEKRTEAIVQRELLRSLLEKRGRLSDDAASLLAGSPYWQTRAMVAAATDVGSAMLARMIENENDLTVLSKIASNPMCNEECLDKLMSLNNSDIEAMIAQRVSSPTSITNRLLQSKSRTVKRLLAQKAGLREECYQQLVNDEFPEVKHLLARNAACPSSILDSLARYADDDIRFALARNPQTSPAILERMREDYATSARTRKVISMRIGGQSTSAVNAGMDAEDYSPERVTAGQGSTEIVREADSQKQLSLAELAVLAESNLVAALTACTRFKVPFVRFCSLIHPLVPADLLMRKASSSLWVDRLAVALNSATSAELLKILVFDGNKHVRAAARHNRNVSNEAYAEVSMAPKAVVFGD